MDDVIANRGRARVYRWLMAADHASNSSDRRTTDYEEARVQVTSNGAASCGGSFCGVPSPLIAARSGAAWSGESIEPVVVDVHIQA